MLNKAKIIVYDRRIKETNKSYMYLIVITLKCKGIFHTKLTATRSRERLIINVEVLCEFNRRFLFDFTKKCDLYNDKRSTLPPKRKQLIFT